MTEAERSILTELALCEPGKGNIVAGGPQRKAARRLVSKGWVDILEGGGLFVAMITEQGRADLSAHSR